MTIDILSLGSGSGGNCYRISDGKSSLLIEAGIPIKKIKAGLNYKLSEVSGCLVSHSHGDHSKAVQDLLMLGTPCYMSRGCYNDLPWTYRRGMDALPSTAIIPNFVYLGQWFDVGTFRGYPFATVHDSKEGEEGDTLGFCLKSTVTGETLVFATDTAFIRPRFKRIDYLMVECNYDERSLLESLRAGSISHEQFKRIMATHFGLNQVIEFLKKNDLSHLKSIHLLHLSNGNSNEEFILKTIRGLTGVPVTACAE